MRLLNFLAIIFLLLTTFIYSGPETYDHLKDYKQNKVKNKGPLLETVFMFGQKKVSTAKYIYNTVNQLIKIEYLTENNQPDGYTIIMYNKKGISQEKTYSKKGDLVESIIYNITKQGIIKSYNAYDSFFNAKIHWKFSLNHKKITAGKRYVNKKLSESFKFKKISSNKKVQYLYNSVGQNNGHIEYRYNNNQLIQRLREDVGGLKRIEYSYDKKGRVKEIKFYKSTKQGMKLIKIHRLSYSSFIHSKAGIKL